MPDLTLLVLTDVHFLHAAQALPSSVNRQCDLGVEMLRRAAKDARRLGGFDAVALLGDLLDGGRAPGVELDAAELARAVNEALGDVPRVVAPGNHDGDPQVLLSALGDRPGLHEVGGYRLYSFVDAWDESDVCCRPPSSMERFAEDARTGADKPLIVLQHNPLWPPIQSDYPYMLSDAERVMKAYAEAGVVLSLSGHYHHGQTLSVRAGVHYWTGGALSDSPFRYALVRLDGRALTIEERALKLPEDLPLWDVHAHTHYAYCSEDVTPQESVRRARLFGLSGVCLTEHSDQLYLTREECLSGRAFTDDDFWCAPRSDESERMPRYRAEVEPLRSDYVKLGVEIELDRVGRPALRAGHRQGWDLMMGAVHWIPGGVEGRSDGEVCRAFMENTEAVLRSGVQVLAHPFRFFRRYKRPQPKELYRPVVEMLARCGAAAEINFHTNDPDVEFFAMCVRSGVKIALGSDAHNLLEVGDFYPHLELLRSAAHRHDVSDLVFHGPWA